MNKEYPELKPVPILTKNLSFWKRIKVWLFYVREWEVVNDWIYDIKIKDSTKTIFIEKGFIFNGASTPKILWPLLSPTGILFIPSLIHDYAYQNTYINIINRDCSLSKLHSNNHKYWDKVFADISKDINGMSIIDSIAHKALVMLGSIAWNKNRKLENN